MSNKEQLAGLKEFIRHGYRQFRRNLSIDCTIFGYHAGELKILLVNNSLVTEWCLPGGYIMNSETLDQAAARITRERTGIDNLFLKQFKTFGDPGRNKNMSQVIENLKVRTGVRMKEDNWLFGETVSIGFYAITDIVNAKPQADMFSSECRWFAVDKLPRLGFDHEQMVKEALKTMRIHLYHYPIGKNLLPKKFTLKEIKLFYEVMSAKTLHVTNFPNKLIAMGLIQKTGEKVHIGAHRSPTCYQFNSKVYEKALRDGIVLV